MRPNYVEVPMARPSNTAARRADIVAGLRAVLPEHGYAGASIRRIARAAGLTPGLVHYHFGSKQEILVALVERLSADLLARIPDPGPDPRRRLRGLVEAWLGLGPGADPDAVGLWVAIAAEATRQPEVQAVYRGAVARSVGALEELVQAARPDLDPLAARRIAVAAQASIEGLLLLSAAAPGVVPRGGAAPAVNALLDAILDARCAGQADAPGQAAPGGAR